MDQIVYKLSSVGVESVFRKEQVGIRIVDKSKKIVVYRLGVEGAVRRSRRTERLDPESEIPVLVFLTVH